MQESLWNNLPWIHKYKKWINLKSKEHCEICLSNSAQWRIKYENNFISWDFSPPWHPNCECQISTKLLNWFDLSLEKDIFNSKSWKDHRTEENWYNDPWLVRWEYFWWETRALKAIKRIYNYIKEKYLENYKYAFAIIYEEQSHLKIFENNYEGVSIDFWNIPKVWKIWTSRWLSQIRYNPPKSDKEYFWYKDVTIESVLDEYSHLKLMNDRINIIKNKLKEESLELNIENIWRAWNWWKSWILSPELNEHSTNYWKRLKLYYDNIDEIISDSLKIEWESTPKKYSEKTKFYKDLEKEIKKDWKKETIRFFSPNLYKK